MIRLFIAFLAYECRPAVAGLIGALPFLFVGTPSHAALALTLILTHDLVSSRLRRRTV